MQARTLLVTPLALAAFGCSLTPSDDGGGGGGPDAAPIRVKTPETGDKTGTGTSPGCDGVTERGECQDGVAVSCDLESDELERTDCGALGKRCILDTTEGAICQAVDNSEGPTCDSGLDFEGYCDGDTARWCDAEGEKAWNCTTKGYECVVDVCERGAFCCDPEGGGGADGGMSTPTECEELGERGECGGEDGQTARYCAGGELYELDCGADESETCQVDSCASGAFCCDADLECDELGYEGECVDSLLRFCTTDGAYHEVDCEADGMICGEDPTEPGVDCQDLSCDEITGLGNCVGDHLVWCESGEIQKTDCAAEEGTTTCGVDGNGYTACVE